MIEVEVSVQINVSAGRVWAELSDISNHVEWMDDAVDIRFTGTKREGLGTTFECDTKVLFFTNTDEMLITKWNDRRGITVHHKGAFTGIGVWTLTPAQDGVTTFTWNEQLTFPWFFGGAIGEIIARPILTKIFRSDVESMKAKAEGPRGVNPLAFFGERNVRVITRHKDGVYTVELRSQKAEDPIMKDYATGKSSFAARLAAVKRWNEEHLA